MKLSVFGASGQTGRLVVAGGLAAGHDVQALVRREGALAAAPGLRIVLGDARELGTATHAVEGADAVVSTMAIPSGTEPITDLSQATRAVAVAMEDAGVARFVVTANTTVFHDDPVADPYAIVAQEHRRNLAMLRDSGLAWTVLAAGFLDDEIEADTYRAAVGEKAPSARISRAAFARAALDALGHEDWIGQVVGVSR